MFVAGWRLSYSYRCFLPPRGSQNVCMQCLKCFIFMSWKILEYSATHAWFQVSTAKQMRIALFWVTTQWVVAIPYQITSTHYKVTHKSTVFSIPNQILWDTRTELFKIHKTKTIPGKLRQIGSTYLAPQRVFQYYQVLLSLLWYNYKNTQLKQLFNKCKEAKPLFF